MKLRLSLELEYCVGWPNLAQNFNSRADARSIRVAPSVKTIRGRRLMAGHAGLRMRVLVKRKCWPE
jgi:hypothetical protein